MRSGPTQQLVHLVHHAVHLLHGELEGLRARHVDAGVLQQLDRVLGATRREELAEALCDRGVTGQGLLRERRGRRERGRVLIDVVVQVEVGVGARLGLVRACRQWVGRDRAVAKIPKIEP